MSRYLDSKGDPVHAEDSVIFPGRPDLKGQRGIVDSFYLKRDGMYRAKVFLVGQGSRAVGVLVSELQKVVPEGPEPVYDPIMPGVAEVEAALSVQGPHRKLGQAIAVLCRILEQALTEVADATRVWPPNLESTEGELTNRAFELQEASAAFAAAYASDTAAQTKHMRVLVSGLVKGTESTLWALG